MKIYPAIDLRGAKAVRLTQGDYNKMSVYSDSPVEVAKTFCKAGAKYLHIVDLDGAKEGSTHNFETITDIVAATGMFCEVGGGIRNMERIEQYLNIGANRVILGTAAINNPQFLKEAVREYGEKIAVGVDAKNGYVAVNGWLDVTSVKGVDFCYELKALGVDTVIYTDIAKDGNMQGTNLPLYEELSKIEGLNITASGGISSIEEIKILNNMNIANAILGKALYTGTLNLAEAISAGGIQ